MMRANSCELEPKFTAGFKLLDRFQTQWANIHSNSEKNVAKAKETISKIDQLERRLGARQRAIDELTVSYRSLSKIQDHIDRLNADIGSLEDCFGKIEDLLIVLKNRKETVDTEFYIEQLEVSYTSRVAEQNEASQAKKEKLRSEHLRRVEEFEAQQQKEFDERRLILERAFEEEKTLYLKKAAS